MQARFFDNRIAAILLVALLARVLGIASRPIWYDEAFSILFAEKGLGAMLYGTLSPTGLGSADIHPLGYYTTLWIWIKIFGEGLVSVRSLSILAGWVSVYLVYRIALGVTSEAGTAYLSMLFAALAPFQIHYAQEIRMYAFLSLWLLLATYAYQRAAREGGWKWWAVFSVTAALAQYSHNLAAFYLVPLALLPVLQRNWKALRGMVSAGIGALILYSPWLVQLPAQFTKVQNSYWVERPDISKLFTLLLVFVTNVPLPAPFIALALVVVLVILTIGILQTVRQTRQRPTQAGIWLLYLSFGPPLLLFLFSQWRPVYIERALLASGAIFCIWLAWVIRNTNLQKPVQYALCGLLGLCSLLGIYQHLTYRDVPYGPFLALDRSLRARVDSQSVIIHSNKLSMLPAMLFDRDLRQSFIGDAPGSSVDTLAAATQEVLKIKAETSIGAAVGDARQVWYVIFARSIDEFRARGHETHPDLEFLASHYKLNSVESWDGLQLYHYINQP